VGVKFAAISGGDTAVIDYKRVRNVSGVWLICPEALSGMGEHTDETAFLITDGGFALISYY